MIYFDTEKTAYQQFDTIERFGKEYLTECTEEEYAELQIGKRMWVDNEIVINPNYDDEQTAKRQAEFNKAFFLTSLGYIRRSVSMADGSKKDFLSDLLPTIAMGVNTGATVPIITYSQPDFTKDVEDWTEYQTVKNVNAQFIQECFLTLSNDFIPSN